MTPLERILKNGFKPFTTKQGDHVKIVRVENIGQSQWSATLKMHTHQTEVEVKDVNKKTRKVYLYGHDFEYLGLVKNPLQTLHPSLYLSSY